MQQNDPQKTTREVMRTQKCRSGHTCANTGAKRDIFIKNSMPTAATHSVLQQNQIFCSDREQCASNASHRYLQIADKVSMVTPIQIRVFDFVN